MSEPLEVKAKSERIIQDLGGEVCDWLPWLDRRAPRGSAPAADRALAMHALLQISFHAPVEVIGSWIQENGLTSALSRRERAILAGGDDTLQEQDRTDLYWSIEALWALVWAGQLIPTLPIDKAVGGNLASLLPNLKVNESGVGFRARFVLRPFSDLYQMLDLYFRAHWYARNGHLRSHATGVFNLDIIMERRKALEWLCDPSIEDWDEAPDST